MQNELRREPPLGDADRDVVLDIISELLEENKRILDNQNLQARCDLFQHSFVESLASLKEKVMELGLGSDYHEHERSMLKLIGMFKERFNHESEGLCSTNLCIQNLSQIMKDNLAYNIKLKKSLRQVKRKEIKLVPKIPFQPRPEEDLSQPVRTEPSIVVSSVAPGAAIKRKRSSANQYAYLFDEEGTAHPPYFSTFQASQTLPYHSHRSSERPSRREPSPVEKRRGEVTCYNPGQTMQAFSFRGSRASHQHAFSTSKMLSHLSQQSYKLQVSYEGQYPMSHLRKQHGLFDSIRRNTLHDTEPSRDRAHARGNVHTQTAYQLPAYQPRSGQTGGALPSSRALATSQKQTRPHDKYSSLDCLSHSFQNCTIKSRLAGSKPTPANVSTRYTDLASKLRRSKAGASSFQSGFRAM